MSRVYEALRQSETESGVAALLDPDSFLSASAVTGHVPQPPSLAWDEMTCFQPQIRAESRMVALTEDASLGAEKFRLLRARLRNLQQQAQQQAQPQSKIRRIVVTSAIPDEGKTLVSMNLAISLAKHSTQKVLLLEGDLRKPTLAVHFGMQNLPGLDDWFKATLPVSGFIHRVAGLQLWILPAGQPDPNPPAILQSARFLELYQLLSQSFDWILIDAPPLLPMADVNFWSRQADGLLLVARQGRTPKKVLKKGLENLDHPRLIGVVLNEASAIDRGYYKDYYSADKKVKTGK